MSEIILKDFQEDAIDFLLTNLELDSDKVISLKAPTGSGKTLILINTIEKYFEMDSKNSVCFWLTPGAGELEEQSQKKFESIKPHMKSKDLQQCLLHGIEKHDTIFINWESINPNTTARRDREKDTLSKRLVEAKLNGLAFFVIIDEGHRNRTDISKDILKLIDPYKKVSVSATPIIIENSENYEVSEEDVINSGLITKSIYLNEDINKVIIDSSNLTTILLDQSIIKRETIRNEYRSIGKKINPLVIIQFPNESPELIKEIETYLINSGYTYENKKLAKWLSGRIENIDNITENDGDQCFLIMKQAISVGWDCPRAKILVGLRQNMGESFKVQTLGRIRRMPEGFHYENEVLDCCYLYTLDSQFISDAINIAGAFERKHVTLKEAPKSFTLSKQLADPQYRTGNELAIVEIIYEGLKKVYKLEADKDRNLDLFKTYGYKTTDKIIMRLGSGNLVTINDYKKKDSTILFQDKEIVASPREFRGDLRRRFYLFNKILRLPENRIRNIFEILFSARHKAKKYNLLKLNQKDFVAFIINNGELLVEFLENLSHTPLGGYQISLPLPKEIEFKIPLNEWYPYDKYSIREDKNYTYNAYNDYSRKMVTSKTRSTSERLFEEYCDSSSNVEWFYKNGDKGEQYFSVVYVDSFGHQKLFYADYVVKLISDDKLWIIETKGGEGPSGSKNIDKFVSMKFEAFKVYASNHDNINWGFVRDKDEELFINNTNYSDKMNTESWEALNIHF